MNYMPAQFQPRPVTPALDIHMIPLLAGELVYAATALSTFDFAIVVMGFLACLSSITQGVANIALPDETTLPVGTSGLLVAPFGSNQSAILNLFSEPIHRFLREYQHAKRPGDREPDFFIDDATREAIVLHLANWGVAALFTDDFAMISSLLRKSAQTLVKLTDGTPMHNARASRGRIALRDQRFAMLGTVQPKMFKDLKGSLGLETGSSGFGSHFIFGQASSLPRPAAITNFVLPPILRARYEARVFELLTETVDIIQRGRERPSLSLGAPAKDRIIEIAAEVTTLRSVPRFDRASEYASQHVERVFRLAGALHVLHHGSTGQVQLESVEAAHQIGLWSIESYLALTETEREPTQAEVDASRLEYAILQAATNYGPWLKKSDLSHTAPNIRMTEARVKRALDLLVGTGKVSLSMKGREDWIYVYSLYWLSLPQPHSPRG